MREQSEVLLRLREKLDELEKQRLSPWACLSVNAIREREEKDVLYGHRQFFSLDVDRILHSLAYTRYIDKAQVFYLIKNDHITHRVLHVQLVSKIARGIGRLLNLNEDLLEAISLGHDIGHAPFGHDGEKILSDICMAYGIGPFLHNVQSVRFLQDIERKGKGWNLSLQVLDGILCHNGEIYTRTIEPKWEKDFHTLKKEMQEVLQDPDKELVPMTMEGCVVRMADIISYIGRDIEDAIRLGIIKRSDLPKECIRVLGDTNGKIVYTLVEDLVANSMNKAYISFSAEVGEALERLKRFNEENIYTNPKIKEQIPKIRLMFGLLFERYMNDLQKGNEDSDIFKGFLDGMSDEYKKKTSYPEMVRDFISGMTDEYFLNQCKKRLVPEIRSGKLI
ncbi:MAG: phosphohydrolase [Deltaproteobacteria bacterium]|nr:MAG: phosphohydrolase [Deltaproteobacteria bacterium]